MRIILSGALNSIVFSLLGMALIFSGELYATSASALIDKTRVIILKPEQLTPTKGIHLSSFSLAAVHDGRMKAIPFQFDERTEQNFIYMPGNSDKYKNKDPLLGSENYFDYNDELIFMLDDAGSKFKKGMRVDGKIVSAIQLTTSRNQKKYVYLIEGARSVADEHYVRLSTEMGRVETDYYALKVDSKNAMMWEEFIYDGFEGTVPGKPIDTIKIWMRTWALGSVPVSVYNKHIKAKTIAEKSGPIRSTIEYRVALTYFKTPLIFLKLQIVHHQQQIQYNVYLKMPQMRRRLMRAPLLRLSIDGNIEGANVAFKGGPNELATVDGRISPLEEQLEAIPYGSNKTHSVWTWTESHKGFSLLTNFEMDSDQPTNISSLYVDDADIYKKPEYYKGNLPSVGVEMSEVPLKGKVFLSVKLDMLSKDVDSSAEEVAALFNNEPNVTVSNW